ncbi:hypothetical protein BH683_007750 [Williamsia sp. 1138]|nr:hypothetical protein BH683_007750 [Williamsia sp. 1138]
MPADAGAGAAFVAEPAPLVRPGQRLAGDIGGRRCGGDGAVGALRCSNVLVAEVLLGLGQRWRGGGVQVPG